MSARIVPICLLAVTGFVANPCLAKGTTIELTITGPGFESPIHTSDPTAVSAIVWGTNFFDSEAGPVSVPDDSLPRMNVYFWVRLPDKSVEMKYVVSYIWQPGGEYAVVCFPGPREAWYEVNVSSILRKGVDGNCFRAENDWGRAIRRILP
jgi:hypothetical protein